MPRKDEITMENKNQKNQSKNEKNQNQTPPPAVPNRAHTEMNNGAKNEKTNKKSDQYSNCKGSK